MSFWRAICLGSALCLAPSFALAQAAPARGRLIVTVADPSSAVVANATVTLVGLEAATKAATIAPLKTTEKGVATFENLVLGRYSVTAEFPGFDLGLLVDVKVSRGDNKHIVVLPLRGLSESVTVGRDEQEAASSRASLGAALTREQVDALSDDPAEMQQQLNEIAGPNATMRIDSFEGQQLPPKSQIKSIHITRDQFAAENHYIGGIFIDIITAPGGGQLRGNGNINYNNDAMNGRTAFAPVKGAEQNRTYNFGFGGTIIPKKLDLSLNVFGQDNYVTPTARFTTGSGIQNETLDIRQPTDNLSVGVSMNYALTRDQTMRLGVSAGHFLQDNLGVGGFNLEDRAYSADRHNYSVYFQEAGPIGRRFFINTRFILNGSTSDSRSVNETRTIVVNDASTTGGAQRAGSTRQHGFSLFSDLDYVRGINSVRAGVQVDAYGYHSDDTSNYLGTYTFTSTAAHDAGLPTFYSQRVGDPTIQYSNVQAGFYVQDDFRVRKGLTLSAGVRYEAQTHVTEYDGFSPRFGFTWSPWKDGKTTIRGGGGVFYDWLDSNTYGQTIRLDGFHQLDFTITNPTYPDPGVIGSILTASRYQLASNYVLPRNVGLVMSVDRTITSRVRLSVGYNGVRGSRVARGRNLNAPINGVRPDLRFQNVIETVSDGSLHQQNVYVQASYTVAPPPQGGTQPRVNWKRLSFNGYYNYTSRRNNSDGPFSVPASGTLDTEWGPAFGNRTHYINAGVSSSQVRNLTFNMSVNARSGAAYNITTGFDDNGDLFFNDRPAGVGRNSATEPDWLINTETRLTYTFTFGRPPVGGPTGISITGGPGGITVGNAPAPVSRYRMALFIAAGNIVNRSNYGGYGGVVASTQFFGQPTTSGVPRRVTVGMNFGF